MRGFGMPGNQGFDFFLPEHGKNLQVLFRIVIRYIEPELIELVWGGPDGIKPHIPLLGLPELPPILFGDQRTGKGKGLTPFDPADQFRPRDNVAPLVGSPHLQLTVILPVKDQKIIPLDHLIGKFR